MEKTVVICVAASAVLLAGCAPTRALTGATLDPENPRVFVVQGATGDHIVVDQDPIVITRKGRSTITWRIETKGYQFDKNGIEFDPKPVKGIAGQVSGCRMVASTEFACQNDNNGKGIHRYDIHLVGPKGMLRVDPSYVND